MYFKILSSGIIHLSNLNRLLTKKNGKSYKLSKSLEKAFTFSFHLFEIGLLLEIRYRSMSYTHVVISKCNLVNVPGHFNLNMINI